MKRTTIYNKVLAIAILALTLTACVKDHLHRTTHPDSGVVSVTTILPDDASYEDYTVEINGTPIGNTTVETTTPIGDGGTSNSVSDPLPPGEYEVVVHNNPDGFTIIGDTVYVNTQDDGESDGIISDPDDLYAGTATVIVTEDDTTQVYVTVKQATRDLRIELTVTEGDLSRIASVTGTLSGIAGAYDLLNGIPCGDPVSTTTAFSVDGDQVTADLTLLGIMGDTQTLTLYIVFTNGDTLVVESDLSEVLADFNDDTTPLTVTGELHLPLDAQLDTATITDWVCVVGKHIYAY